MYCINCGKYNPDGAKFCSECGKALSTPFVSEQDEATVPANELKEPVRPSAPAPQYGYNDYYGQVSAQEQPANAYYGAGYNSANTYPQQNGYQPYYNAPIQPQRKMGWHKFLIYFSLFAGAVMNVISAVTVMFGTQYQGEAARVYRMYSGLKAIDIIYGIALLLMAALCIYTRFRLAGFKKNGPSMLITLYIAELSFSILYLIFASSVTGIQLFSAEYAGDIIGSVIMLVVNSVYYKHRRDMFIN